ncbi:hypothetical protein [Ferrimonas balearica]|uniref:hypothetical protein n=1 Tax=Ferrimonas balearica TaxID=44012 RepID=UPI001C58D50F|nr:hypothetical protein [Ferrimonas balearica]MBW3163981.1 hypothetical protein [Ferrimonas balearica]
MDEKTIGIINLVFIIYLVHKMLTIENMLRKPKLTPPKLSEDDITIINERGFKAIRHIMSKYSLNFSEAKDTISKNLESGTK